MAEHREPTAPSVDGWQPIETAPRDFTPILAYAIGVDGGHMIDKVRWACAKHSFSSKHQCSRRPWPSCEFEWTGDMGMRYGVEFTHWVPLPLPPTGLVELGGRSNTDPQQTTAAAPSSAEIKAAKDWYWHHGEGNRPREDEFFIHLARYAAATPPSPPAVVGYTERADAVANELVKAGLIPDQGGLFIPIRAKIAAALFAVASEHQAALHEARQAWMAIEAHRNQLLAKLARLREPETLEAVRLAMARVSDHGNAYVQNLNRADAALAVITEKLT